jgi:hypothetical protein
MVDGKIGERGEGGKIVAGCLSQTAQCRAQDSGNGLRGWGLGAWFDAWTLNH